MTTRKSRKGFKKLHDQELSEFTSLGNGGGALDSGSENEILDLTTVEEGEPRGRWSSCCCWCSCLYFGLLTCLFLLLGVYSGYLTYTLWQMSEATTATHRDLETRLASMETEMSRYKTEISHKYQSLHGNLSSLQECMNTTRESLRAVQQSMTESMTDLGSEVINLDERLKVVESKPQDVLIKQVDMINRDMGLLNSSMRQLNTSLADIKLVKNQIADSMAVHNNYDAQLKQIKENMAEVRQENSEMKEAVDAAVNTAADFKSRLDSVDTTLESSHNQMKQSTDLLSAQMTNLQQILSALNDSLRAEMDILSANISMIDTSVEKLAKSLSLVQTELVQIQNQTPDSVPETKDHTPTAPPTPPPTTAKLTEPPQTTTEQRTESNIGGDETELPTVEITTYRTESTGATEDSVPLNETNDDSKIETTATVDSNVEYRLAVETELNSTQNAIALLQSLADAFTELDDDNDNALSMDEFMKRIPKPYIFSIMDLDGDGSLTIEELYKSITNLQIKRNELSKEIKAMGNTEEETVSPDGEDLVTTEEEQFVEGTLDPELQKKLMELYDYIMNPKPDN